MGKLTGFKRKIKIFRKNHGIKHYHNASILFLAFSLLGMTSATSDNNRATECDPSVPDAFNSDDMTYLRLYKLNKQRRRLPFTRIQGKCTGPDNKGCCCKPPYPCGIWRMRWPRIQREQITPH